MAIIKINFRGGIISPGDLYEILNAASRNGIREVRFGLRQQMYIEAEYASTIAAVGTALQTLGIPFEVDLDDFPNVVSSYPAEEVFIAGNWLTESVYKELFQEMDYQPRLKINISNNNQSFTPSLTGNVNWIASRQQHYWHLFIRFPRTNVVYEWKDLVYTTDMVHMSRKIEEVILGRGADFYDNPKASGADLYKAVMDESFNVKPATARAVLPMFNLPYYEGLNEYNGKYWLGIYRRDEWFLIDFLQDLCLLCLQLKIGQLCSTPWKSLIVKGIEEKDKAHWNYLLSKYQINIRHAANELNFQVEDNCPEGLALKHYLVKHLSRDDIRTFGICIGIKTRRKSEVFSSILVRQRPVLSIGKKGLFFVYDILIAKDFNPNERTGSVFSSGNPKVLLPEQLRRAILKFYEHEAQNSETPEVLAHTIQQSRMQQHASPFYKCSHCHTIYDERRGEPEHGIQPGTPFDKLPDTYICPLCEAGKEEFVHMELEES